LRDFVQPDGELGYFASRFDVYGREGKACACGGTVKRIVQGGRSTWFCPRCQR
jgi:formamidopyrimidine-DNA glycosylase